MQQQPKERAHFISCSGKRLFLRSRTRATDILSLVPFHDKMRLDKLEKKDIESIKKFFRMVWAKTANRMSQAAPKLHCEIQSHGHARSHRTLLSSKAW